MKIYALISTSDQTHPNITLWATLARAQEEYVAIYQDDDMAARVKAARWHGTEQTGEWNLYEPDGNPLCAVLWIEEMDVRG